MKKMKPIPCTVNTQYGGITGHANLYTGEIILKNSFFWTNDSIKVSIDFNNKSYEYTIKGIGGKYFVVDYKNEPLFKDVYLNEKLKKTIPKNQTASTKKSKI